MGCDVLAAEKADEVFRPATARCPDTAGIV